MLLEPGNRWPLPREPLVASPPLKIFGVVGAGVIGAGWATRALALGFDVVATDPAAGAEGRLRDAVDRAWPAVAKLGLARDANPDRLLWLPSPAAVAAAADFVQESAPEHEETKAALLAEIDAAAPTDIVVASSSSGLLPSRIQADCGHPERVLVGHPFNPVYLLPLVEVVGGSQTSPAAVDRALDVYRRLGMHPLLVRNEIEGYLADRLQEAQWREILHLVNDGIATTDGLDQAIVYGPGLRWAAMGTNLIFHLAGGASGMAHMLEQFGPALELPWTRLEAPDLTDELVATMVDGTAEQADGRSVAELERLRDDCIVAVMRALRPFGVGGGETLAAHEALVLDTGAPRWTPSTTVDAPLELYRCRVAPDWVDYNGHLTESAYLLAFGWASDALFRFIGIDEKYRDDGHSLFTVETHINYLAECSTDEPLRFTTQLLAVDSKRVHLFHAMHHGESGELLCTTEQMLLHVDTTGGGASPIPTEPRAALDAIMAVHKDMAVPSQVGSQMGAR